MWRRPPHGRPGCKRAAAVPATVLVGSSRVLGRGCERVRAGVWVCRVVAWCVDSNRPKAICAEVVDALLSLVSTTTVVNHRDLYFGYCFYYV